VSEARDTNPYVGPRPFERGDASHFFGREREVRDLASIVVAHRVVLLYSASGAGKSSRLNAAVLPMLETKKFDLVPPARVGALPPGLAGTAVENVFVAGLVAQWSGAEGAPEVLAHASLAAFLRERPRPLDEEGEVVPRAIVLDQFEELFTAHPERWRDQAGLFDALRAALDDDAGLRIVLALREEYLAQLESYLHLLPGRPARFRLEPLDATNALAAVTLPLRGTNRRFDAGAAEALVEDLLKLRVETGPGHTVEIVGEYVEPVQLQVVCRQLWSELPPDVDVITTEHLRAFADLDTVLTAFYEEALASANTETRVSEPRLRAWVGNALITAGSTRSTVYRGAEATAGMENAAVEALERKRLIRAEQRAGAFWYELTHDRLIEPIGASNLRFFAERARRRLRRSAVALVALLAATFGLVFLFNPWGSAGAQVPATLTPQAVNFGATSDPAPSPPQRLTFSSGSDARSIRITTSGDAESFTLTNGCLGRVPARGTCTIGARFKPATLGAQHARVRVLVDGRPSVDASLSGRLNGFCGAERGLVKTLQDPAATRINRVALQTTIGKLTRLTAPRLRPANTRIAPVELRTYRVRARLIAMTLTDASDIKLVIADSRTGVNMIAKFPAPWCTLNAPPALKALMNKARTAVETACGTPGANFAIIGGNATITGVGYFESVHGQRGVAPNGIEIHPVLGFSAKECGFGRFTTRGRNSAATVVG
jgi:hypothetical protein